LGKFTKMLLGDRVIPPRDGAGAAMQGQRVPLLYL
jgi:hypothetical protein